MQTKKDEMTQEQYESMESALNRFQSMASAKYKEGQKEHGGNLWEKECLMDEIEKEIIDQWFYIQAVKQKLKKIRSEIRKCAI